MHSTSKIFQIHLVHDTNTRWNDPECIKGLHTPFNKLITLVITLKLNLHIETEGLLITVMINLYRMINHQVNRHQRLDHIWILTHALCHTTHCRKIHQERDARKILQNDTSDHKGNLIGTHSIGLPIGELAHMRLSDLLSIAITQYRFEHDADRDR